MADYDLTRDDDIIVEPSGDTSTVLKSLEAELKKEVSLPPIVLSVPSRPGMTIRYDVNIDSNAIQQWRKQSQNKSMQDNFDGLKFATLVIANRADCILFNGVEARTDDGEELNFKNPAILDMTGTVKALDAVRKVYGVDGHIFIAADEIVRAAGYDSDGQEQQTDPTLIS